MYVTFYNVQTVIDPDWQSPYPDDPNEWPEGRDEKDVVVDQTEAIGPFAKVEISRYSVVADGRTIASIFSDDSWTSTLFSLDREGYFVYHAGHFNGQRTDVRVTAEREPIE